MNLANDILARHADRLTTRRAVCQPGLTSRMPGLLAESLPAGRWLLVADENTRLAQGQRLADALAAAGLACEALILSPAPGRAQLACETAAVEQVSACLTPPARAPNPNALGLGTPAPGQGPPIPTHRDWGPQRRGFAAVIAVGSGTICDTVKLAAAEGKVPCAAVATAPSMNGYPSIIAAVLRDGVKMTEPTRSPVVVLADLDTLCAAPARMLAAGLADLLAKPVSTADWTLAHELLGDPVSADGMAVVEESARLAEGVAPGLPRREQTAVARLFEALFISGVAMAVSGMSSPASGGEHMISHYLDMTALSGGREHDLHGLQVGVGTLVTAAMYRRLLDWNVAGLDIGRRVRSQPPWRQVEAALRDHFGPALAAQVIPQARRLHAEGDGLAERLSRLRAAWPELRIQLARRLEGAGLIEERLRACGAATRFSEIGVDRDRAIKAITHARFVRARYTILHLLADLGLLEQWAAAILAERA